MTPSVLLLVLFEIFRGAKYMEVKAISNSGNDTLKNFLSTKINKNSKIDITAANFSIYAFSSLFNQFENSDELRVLLTDSFFKQNETEFLKRYKIAQNNNKMFGNKYEIKLRNKMNTSFIAKELENLIEDKISFHELSDDKDANGTLMVYSGEKDNTVIPSFSSMTSDVLGVTESDSYSYHTAILDDDSYIEKMKENFDDLWNDKNKSSEVTDKVIEKIKTIYQENSPEWIYFVSLYHIFHDKLNELDEDSIAPKNSDFKNSIIWNTLYDFQKDGVMGLIRKLEKYNGAILADSVGLGKTFSALAVIKYFELKRKRVLVLSPKRLRDNWTLYTTPDVRNILRDDYFNYTVLNHTDLGRDSGKSGEINLESFSWSDFDLVVIDESHNFRNNNSGNNGKKSRYQRLMDDVIKSGRETKILMLSATPINNRMNDLKNQISLMTEENTKAFNDYGINDIDNELKKAQTVFNSWMKLDPEEKTTQSFLEKINPGYFKILDMLTIARSRKHIEKYYDTKAIGSFPERLKPITLKSDIDNSGQFPDLQDVYKKIGNLNMSIYQPLQYVIPEKKYLYEELYDTNIDDGKSSFKQVDREMALANLIRANLFKRLESSIYSLGLTIDRMINKIENTLNKISESTNENIRLQTISEFDDENIDEIFSDQLVGNKTQIFIGDIDLNEWSVSLTTDLNILKDLRESTKLVDSDNDAKLSDLKALLREKIEHPINGDNKKVIIFTAFADTAKYLYDHLSIALLENYHIHSALVTGGSGDNKATLYGVNTNDVNDILTNFSPISKGRDKTNNSISEEIDLLIATDTISEGQNLQDADYLINYDIHWNPVRVIQRFGRIDRIGSKNKRIQLVNFWPNVDLDTYLNLEQRVKGRMVMLNISATGEDDILNSNSNKEMNDLKFRKNQLQQLQKDVVDLEEVNGAISITDLTFNDFKSDLQNALNKYESSLNSAPLGMYAVVDSDEFENISNGVILVLKENVNKISDGSLLPYIVIFVGMDGKIRIQHTQPQKVLSLFKKLSLGNEKVNSYAVNRFYDETDGGRDMSNYSSLLSKAVEAVKGVNDEADIESIFHPGGTNIRKNIIQESNDVELISFLVIK